MRSGLIKLRTIWTFIKSRPIIGKLITTKYWFGKWDPGNSSLLYFTNLLMGIIKKIITTYKLPNILTHLSTIQLFSKFNEEWYDASSRVDEIVKPSSPTSPKSHSTLESSFSSPPLSSPIKPNAPDDKTYHEFTKALTILNSSSPSPSSSDFFVLIYSNRSASYYQCSQWQEAVDDANQVIRIRADWQKGYFRKAEALVKLEKYDEAIENYYNAKLKDPQNHQISLRIAKTLILKDNKAMGLAIYTLVPGRDICLSKNSSMITSPIQKKIHEFAIEMKNLIHLIVDVETKKCVVIDACWDIDGILRFIRKKDLNLVGAIVTHYHFDHVGGSPPPPYNQLPIKVSGLYTLMKRAPTISCYINTLDLPYVLKSNPNLLEFQQPQHNHRIIPTTNQFILPLGNLTLLRFLHTPGHTEGSQSVLVNETRLFTGDVLMCSCSGRVDLPGGNQKEMKKTLRERLARLDDRVIIYPGHDYGGDWTTVGLEKRKGVIGRLKKHLSV
ncbi:8841_t:CDS:2 [Entrophospora sp. SA101]|nr:8841_t:CDS:2 [Entrophospora sp. SA101]